MRRLLGLAAISAARPDEGYLFVTNRGDEAVAAARSLIASVVLASPRRRRLAVLMIIHLAKAKHSLSSVLAAALLYSWQPTMCDSQTICSAGVHRCSCWIDESPVRK